MCMGALQAYCVYSEPSDRTLIMNGSQSSITEIRSEPSDAPNYTPPHKIFSSESLILFHSRNLQKPDVLPSRTLQSLQLYSQEMLRYISLPMCYPEISICYLQFGQGYHGQTEQLWLTAALPCVIDTTHKCLMQLTQLKTNQNSTSNHFPI